MMSLQLQSLFPGLSEKLYHDFQFFKWIIWVVVSLSVAGEHGAEPGHRCRLARAEEAAALHRVVDPPAESALEKGNAALARVAELDPGLLFVPIVVSGRSRSVLSM